MPTVWIIIAVAVSLTLMGGLLVYSMAQSARSPSKPINTAPIDADFDQKKKQESDRIAKNSQEELLARLNDDLDNH